MDDEKNDLQELIDWSNREGRLDKPLQLPSGLSQYSDEEIEAEIEERREIKRKMSSPPQPRISTDVTSLKQVCSEEVVFMANHGRTALDAESKIAAAALAAIYGTEVHEWLELFEW